MCVYAYCVHLLLLLVDYERYTPIADVQRAVTDPMIVIVITQQYLVQHMQDGADTAV